MSYVLLILLALPQLIPPGVCLCGIIGEDLHSPAEEHEPGCPAEDGGIDDTRQSQPPSSPAEPPKEMGLSVLENSPETGSESQRPITTHTPPAAPVYIALCTLLI
jgi:hypothetical protein